jgi:hypothetical protein
MSLAALVATGAMIQPAAAQPQPAAGAPSPQKLEEAKQHMAAGSAFYNDPSGHKCEEAVLEFQKAFDLSGSWKALRAMAICELQLERDGDAIKHYEEVQKLGGDQISAADKSQIESDLRALKAGVAHLTLRTNRPSTKVVAVRQPSQGLPVTNRYTVNLDGTMIGIHPGNYEFTASADGFPDVTWKAEITNGSETQKQIEFTEAPPDKGPGGGPVGGPAKAPEMERPIPVTVWILGGVTIACAITSGTFMGLSTAAKSEYDDKNGVAPRTEVEDLRSDLITKNIVADVFLGATVASAGATLLFFLLRPEVPVEKGQEARVFVLPSVGTTGGGAVVVGTF